MTEGGLIDCESQNNCWVQGDGKSMNAKQTCDSEQ